MQSTSELLPKVLVQLPAPSSAEPASPTNPPTISANYCNAGANERPLKTTWQQRRLNLEAFCPAVQVMADAVEAWCMNLYRNGQLGRMLTISGPFGLGKTESLRAAKRYARDIAFAAWPTTWPRPITSIYVNWSDFIREQVGNNNREQMEDIVTADAIFIDDIGSEEDAFKSGAPTRILGDVLGKLERKFVLITTNISPAKGGWRARWDGRVEDRLLRRGAHVVDLWRPELRAESYARWQLRQG
jgi:DNA replication protein DnaC